MLAFIIWIICLFGFAPNCDEIEKELEAGKSPVTIIAEWIGNEEVGG